MSDERMSLVLDGAQLVLWDWDVESDRVWMSREGRRYFGLEPDEQPDVSWLDARVHPDDRAMRAAMIRRALETSGSYEVEYRIVMPDGSVRWVSGRGRYSSVAAKGAPARMLGVSMDITSRKQAEAEVHRQREALEHLSRAAAASVLSGSLAHELSQPLGSILLNADAGQQIVSKGSPDLVELRAIFADIAAQDLRAGEIIERLRTMLRRGAVALQAVRVTDAIEDLLRLARGGLIARHVSVSNLVANDLPAVMTDRVQLQQVLLNLILNACDAMKSNAPEDRKLVLTGFVDKDEVRIGVLDCGVGLPDDVEILFQPFYTTKEDGLGMGLSICRTMLASHGGRLWGERREDRGAAFYVALPLA
jgi:PAS domain S-box-containing protein